MLYHERKGSGRALHETRATMDDKHLKVDGRYKGFEAGSGGGATTSNGVETCLEEGPRNGIREE